MSTDEIVPYVKIPLHILEDRTLSSLAKLAYGRLRLYAENDSGTAWPSMDKLGRDIGKSDRQVRREVLTLVKRGLLKAKARRGQTTKFTFPDITPDTSGRGDRIGRGTKSGKGPRTELVGDPGQICPPKTISEKYLRDNKIDTCLDTPEFQEAWDHWETFRREKKKTITASTKVFQLRKLAKHDVAVAIQAIHDSITAGWQGLFPESVEKRIEELKAKATPEIDPIMGPRKATQEENNAAVKKLNDELAAEKAAEMAEYKRTHPA